VIEDKLVGMDGKAKRRGFASVVTEEAISKEMRRVRGFLQGCEHHSVPPTTDGVEVKRRGAVLNKAATFLLFGALVALKAYEPSHYGRLFMAVRLISSTALKRGKAAFVIQRPRRGRAFAEWLLGMGFLEAHKALTKRLQRAWKQQAPVTMVRSARFVSRKGRYGSKQHFGFQQHVARQRARVTAVCRESQDLFGRQGDVVERKLDERTALRLVRTHRTPARVSCAVFAHLCDLTPRAMRTLLIRAQKQAHESERIHALLDLRGYQRLGRSAGA